MMVLKKTPARGAWSTVSRCYILGGSIQSAALDSFCGPRYDRESHATNCCLGRGRSAWKTIDHPPSLFMR
ncbi:hypothetical protein E2C01_058341 [Portunus trituberculatus]|uniref:Uncharacterized protein n=1 Tax=Portunus trituberculatus TaxID=210409 RepID=A0A5B7GW64_PORTR|nr:hypothetical protein [Portunus trituberculatus]